MNYKNKICFITGGANGIGEGIVKAFYEAEASVFFCDIDIVKGKQIQTQYPGTVFFPLDVKNKSELTSVMDKIYKENGDIDILINNVGIGHFPPLTETTVEDFDFIIATNLRPVFITSQYMAVKRNNPEGKKRYGSIINIASTRWLQSEPGTVGYSASKGGIVSHTFLAISLSEYNITVNCISPGWIDTGHYKIKPEDHQQHPSGRVGKPEDIARTCLFLSAEENNFINGQNIVVDGGMTKKMIYVE